MLGCAPLGILSDQGSDQAGGINDYCRFRRTLAFQDIAHQAGNFLKTALRYDDQEDWTAYNQQNRQQTIWHNCNVPKNKAAAISMTAATYGKCHSKCGERGIRTVSPNLRTSFELGKPAASGGNVCGNISGQMLKRSCFHKKIATTAAIAAASGITTETAAEDVFFNEHSQDTPTFRYPWHRGTGELARLTLQMLNSLGRFLVLIHSGGSGVLTAVPRVRPVTLTSAV